MDANEIMNIYNKRQNSQINIENQHLVKYRVRYFGLVRGDLRPIQDLPNLLTFYIWRPTLMQLDSLIFLKILFEYIGC